MKKEKVSLVKKEKLNLVKREERLYKNVRFNRLMGFWIGGKRHDGMRINSHARTPLEAARILNRKCRELGAIPPNPGADAITWESIEREINEDMAKQEIIAMNEKFLENWSKVLPKYKLIEFFKMINGRVLQILDD